MRRRCSHCGSMETLPFTCRYCGQPHCADHRLPENHDCAGLEQYKEQLREQGRLVAESPKVRVRREIEEDDEGRGAGGGILGGLGGGSGGPAGGRGQSRLQTGGGPHGPAAGRMMARGAIGQLLEGRTTHALLLAMVAVTAAGFFVQSSLSRSAFVTHFTVHAGSLSAPWSVATSIFAHGGFGHILLNGLVLFFFGPAVERRIGSRDLVVLFLVAGAVAGVAQLLFGLALGSPIPVLGASGAILAVMGVLLVLEPNATVLLFFMVPLPLWVVVVGYAVIDFVSLIAQPVGGGVAHLAHLVGLAIGIVAARRLYARRTAASTGTWGA